MIMWNALLAMHTYCNANNMGEKSPRSIIIQNSDSIKEELVTKNCIVIGSSQ